MFSDSASYLRGAHSIKFGGEWRRFRNTNFTSDTGLFQFPNLAGFQTGVGNQFTITSGDRPSDVVQQALGLFAQDAFRLSPKLTIEAGIRYDLNMAPTEAEDRFVVFDASTNSLVQVGGPGGPDRVHPNSNNVEPRVGLIWSPTGTGRTVVRGARDRRGSACNERGDPSQFQPAARNTVDVCQQHPPIQRCSDCDGRRTRARFHYS